MSEPSRAVTVVVPTRDRAEVCAQTLRSVLGQRDVDLQVIVVDEGSTDGTPTMLANLDDDRVEIVRHDPARGLPAARNAGLERTATPWVAFCDDDDLWAPDKLAAQLAAASEVGAAWVVGGAVLVDESLRVIGHQPVLAPDTYLERLRIENVVPAGGSNVLVAVDAARAVGGFDETLASCEDWDLWARLAMHCGAPAVVDRPLVRFRIWRGSMSTVVDRMRTTRAEVLRRYGGSSSGDYDHERWLAKQLVRGDDRVAAARAYAGLGRRHRRPTDLVRAALVLVAPSRLASAGDERARARVPEAWLAEVAGW